MPERGGELPSRIIQSKLRNPYSKSPHVLFSSGAAGEAVAGLYHIALRVFVLERIGRVCHNFGGSYDDWLASVCVCVSHNPIK
jgi:hypothetical protein